MFKFDKIETGDLKGVKNIDFSKVSCELVNILYQRYIKSKLPEQKGIQPETRETSSN